MAVGQFFLGRGLDAGGLVRKAPGLSQLQAGPHPVDDRFAADFSFERGSASDRFFAKPGRGPASLGLRENCKEIGMIVD